MAKATINEPDVEYDVVFWDGLEYDAASKTGHQHVVLTSPVDEKNRGLIYGEDGKTYSLFPGDAIIKHLVDGKVVLVTAMDHDAAVAKFNIHEGAGLARADDVEATEVTWEELALPSGDDEPVTPHG